MLRRLFQSFESILAFEEVDQSASFLICQLSLQTGRKATV